MKTSSSWKKLILRIGPVLVLLILIAVIVNIAILLEELLICIVLIFLISLVILRLSIFEHLIFRIIGLILLVLWSKLLDCSLKNWELLSVIGILMWIAWVKLLTVRKFTIVATFYWGWFRCIRVFIEWVFIFRLHWRSFRAAVCWWKTSWC